MKNLIVANWKCNPITKKEAEEIFSALGGPALGWKGVEVVICPPFLYIPILVNLKKKGLVLGGQNCFYEDKGAFTGKISAPMLKDLGVEYVIIGHSEVRKLGETDETINKKIKKALETGLKVIFCIGETAQERDAGKKNEVLEKQIKKGLDGISAQGGPASGWENLNIAYEPVWAIGTGNNCSVDEAKKAFDFIRKFVKDARILYGGSVKSENSGAYIKEAGANGLLVGGASLNAEEFAKIVKSAE